MPAAVATELARRALGIHDLCVMRLALDRLVAVVLRYVLGEQECLQLDDDTRDRISSTTEKKCRTCISYVA